jgi:two-component system response regulator HydG
MNKTLQALVIDDEPQVRKFVASVLRDDGWEVSEAGTAVRAVELLREGRWALVFCDVNLGDGDGFAVLQQFVAEQPEARVVIMTGYGSAAGALNAVASGAYDYLLKPFTVDDISSLSQIVRARGENDASASHDEPAETASEFQPASTLIGRSAALVGVMKLVARVARTNLPVLITGESGTGKELVAEAIASHSPRAGKPFIVVNCGALPSELIESELFGHVRGAFTSADRDRRGLWEEASGGTIFLDEITETALSFQVKLLRALQTGEIRRVGSNQIIKTDVRVIAASNRDVEEEARENRFRQDLMYRLNAVTIRLPPLRERREDILLIAQSIAARTRVKGDPPLTFSDEAVALLENYQWNGNIRELENAVMRAAAICDRVVRAEDLPARIRLHVASPLQHEHLPLTDAAQAIFCVEDWLPLSSLKKATSCVCSHTPAITSRQRRVCST